MLIISIHVLIMESSTCSGMQSSNNAEQNPENAILYDKGWYTPTNLLHKSLNLLQITDIASLFQLTFVHNHQHGNLPEFFSYYYISKENIHNIITRNRSNTRYI